MLKWCATRELVRAFHVEELKGVVEFAGPGLTERDDGLERFCAVQWPRLVGALSLHCGDRGVAEELAQDALERACRRWDEVRVMTYPEAWVHRVAINLSNSRGRRVAASWRALLRHGGTRERDDSADLADRVAVREAVAGLPRRLRTVLVLRFFLGYSPDEAGTVMDCSGQAVRNLTHRAVRTLREELGDDVAHGSLRLEARDVL